MRSRSFPAFLLVTACLTLTGPMAPADNVRLTLELADRIRVSERSNLLRTEDGRYIGLTNRQVSGYLTASADRRTYAGRMIAYEETLRDLSQVGRPVDGSYSATLRTDSLRAFVSSDGVPAYIAIPSLPETPVAAGDSWSAPGALIIPVPHGLPPVTVEVDVAYRYEGTELFGGEAVHRIEAAFATRYPPPPDPDAESPPALREDIRRIAGRHRLSILVPAGSSAPFFIRDELEEQYDLEGKPQTLIRGHRLLFVYGLSAEAQEMMATDLERQLSESGTEDVVVERTDTGTRLTLQHIHFVPDQAVILEDEGERLSGVARALASMDGVRFLVVGHTADVGSAESQEELSWDRARVVAAELAARGIDPMRIDLEGRGGREPVASNADEAGRAQNRRVEIYILEE